MGFGIPEKSHPKANYGSMGLEVDLLILGTGAKKQKKNLLS